MPKKNAKMESSSESTQAERPEELDKEHGEEISQSAKSRLRDHSKSEPAKSSRKSK
jgi:hypothetical protein